MPSPRISLTRIEQAASVIDPIFLNSPQVTFDPLSAELGAELVLKVETLNPIRSFKGRGGDFFVHCLDDRTPLVTASAGNFGQGLAFAARKRGIDLHVFAPQQANSLKVRRMNDLGAHVVSVGSDFDMAKDIARQYAVRAGMRFVEDGLETPISEGAGTIARELMRWPKTFDAVLIPVGNGALISGMGAWIKDQSPATQVIGVCASNAPSMELSWRSGMPVSTPTATTIADGISVRSPVPAAVEDTKHFVDDFLLVGEEVILRAMRALLRHTGILVEPSGAVGVAAIMAHSRRFAGKTLATPLCGGNVTPDQMKQWFCN